MYILLASLSVILVSICYYYQKKFSYWRDKGVPQLNPTFPLGDLKQVWRKSRIYQFADFYKAFSERGEKIGGIYMITTPVLVLTDPEVIKTILVTDFHHFHNRGFYLNEEKQPIQANLVFIEGNRWKQLRQKLTPTFSSGKMKMLSTTVLKCTPPLEEYVRKMSEINEAMEVKDMIGRFTTDVIGSCAFGIDCNSFENPDSNLRKYSNKILQETKLTVFKSIFVASCDRLAKSLGITLLDRESENFFSSMAVEIYEYRKNTDTKRNDFMQLLMELKDKKEDPITMTELIAQVFIFFLAGYDTSASTLSFCLFNLASHLEVQEKLREEIQAVLSTYSGEITYEALQDLKYMDQVIKESMRMYPITAWILRVCSETYRIPNTDVVIDEGTKVFTSPWALHKDPKYFPNPEKFDPDRFSDENKRNIIPGTYIPFGDGPRGCIGTRFAMMQMKVALTALLRQYEFTINAKTKLPLELDFGLLVAVKGGIWINAKKVS